MAPFDSQVILVTGAGSGIGRATSIKLATLGASLALSDIKFESIAETASLCAAATQQQKGLRVTTHAVDISDAAEVDLLIAAVVDQHGRLDHVLNCAGINPTPTSVVGTTSTYANLLINVNLLGTFNVCRASIPHLQSGSSVVNISSIAGVRPPAGMAIYAATKSGVIGFSKSMAIELGPKGIRTNVVAPGDIHTATNAAIVAGDEAVRQSTERIALGRLGKPEEVADAVIFLFQNTYINGSVVEVNGGVL